MGTSAKRLLLVASLIMAALAAAWFFSMSYVFTD